MQDQSFVRSELLDYLKHAQPGNSVAIFGLNTRLLLLQGFTSDPEVLKGILEHKHTQSSPLLHEGGDLADEAAQQELAMGDIPTQILSKVEEFGAQQKANQLQFRVKLTLDAMNMLSRYLAAIPGRKNLVWFSGSFPLNFSSLASATDRNGTFHGNPADAPGLEQEFREAINLFAASQVAVYPIDARGVMVSPTLQASDSGAGFGASPRNYPSAENGFSNQIMDEHSTMGQIAEDTGGKAFVNTNNLNQSIARAIDAGSSYYSLAYSPSDKSVDHSYRTIQVSLPGLSGQKYTLAYRRGYYADQPNAASETGQANSAGVSEVTRAGLLHGAPAATQVVFDAGLRPVTDPVGPASRDATQKPCKGPGSCREYSVIYVADPNTFSYESDPDGTRHGKTQYVCLLYDAEGKIIDDRVDAVAMAYTTEQFAALLKQGLTFHQTLNLPDSGSYWLRIAVRDQVANRLGSLEVPLSGVRARGTIKR